MPSEPVEAEFIRPPALTNAQEDEYRILDREGPLSRHSTHTETFVGSGTPGSPEVTVKELEADRTREGYHIVSFVQEKIPENGVSPGNGMFTFFL